MGGLTLLMSLKNNWKNVLDTLVCIILSNIYLLEKLFIFIKAKICGVVIFRFYINREIEKKERMCCKWTIKILISK